MRARVVRTQWRCNHACPAPSSRVSAALTQRTRWRSLLSPQAHHSCGQPPAATRSLTDIPVRARIGIEGLFPTGHTQAVLMSVRFSLDGESFELSPELVRARLDRQSLEDIREC